MIAIDTLEKRLAFGNLEESLQVLAVLGIHEIENLMVEMGYKKETEKLHDAFREVAKRVIEQGGISHPDYWNFLRIIEAHEEGLEFLARQAA